jgi:hypothetical protein
VAQARRDEVGLFQRDDPLQLQAFELKRDRTITGRQQPEG